MVQTPVTAIAKPLKETRKFVKSDASTGLPSEGLEPTSILIAYAGYIPQYKKMIAQVKIRVIFLM